MTWPTAAVLVGAIFFLWWGALVFVALRATAKDDSVEAPAPLTVGERRRLNLRAMADDLDRRADSQFEHARTTSSAADENLARNEGERLRAEAIRLRRLVDADEEQEICEEASTV